MNIGTRIKDMFKGMWEDTRAVSPIVATLVLVVVAITGAAGTGMIMGTFSSDVSEDAGSAELVTGSSTELLIAGSTTVQPVSELLAEAYMDDHQGVKITVQGGGSGAGIASAGMEIVDIGAASKPVDPMDYVSKGYDLEVYQIGGSAVVVIGNKDLTSHNVNKSELKELYNATATNTGTNITDVTNVFQRYEASGTEETFADYLFSTKDVDDAGATSSTGITQGTGVGNAGVLANVESTPKSIGFVDYGFAAKGDTTKMKILGIYDPDAGKLYTPDKSTIKAELKNDDGANYVKGLTRPLNYITNGEPSSLEQGFINFARSPGATEYFGHEGYFAITEFA